MRLPRKYDYSASAREFRNSDLSAGKLHRGNKILVLLTDWDGSVVGTARARIVHSHRGRITARSIGDLHSRGNLYRRHEGRTWARGWDTPEAMVLAAEIALLVSQ